MIIPRRLKIEVLRIAELGSAAVFGGFVIEGFFFPHVTFILFAAAAAVAVGVASYLRDHYVESRPLPEEAVMHASEIVRETYQESRTALISLGSALELAAVAIEDVNAVMIQQEQDLAEINSERIRLARIADHLDEIRSVVASPRRTTAEILRDAAAPALPPAGDPLAWMRKPPRPVPSEFVPKRLTVEDLLPQTQSEDRQDQSPGNPPQVGSPASSA